MGNGAVCAASSQCVNRCCGGFCRTPRNGGWSGWGGCFACMQSRACSNPSPRHCGSGCSGRSVRSCCGRRLEDNTTLAPWLALSGESSSGDGASGSSGEEHVGGKAHANATRLSI